MNNLFQGIMGMMGGMGGKNPMQMMGQMQQMMGGQQGQINPMQMLQQFQQNPQGLMQQFGDNPQMQRAQEMLSGKSPQEQEQVVRNMCQNMGIDFEQARQMAQQFGVKI